MIEFVLYCVPAVVYLLVQSRGPERHATAALAQLGVRWGRPSDYGWAAVLLVPLILAGWLAIVLIPATALDAPGVSVARLTSVGAVLSVILRAVGEEVLFRGLLGGVLVRRLGFWRGNTLQAVVFALPHLLLLAIDVRTWPIIPVQFAAGWLLGWLRTRSGSLLPGALAHAVSNIAAGLIVAVSAAGS